MDKMTCFEKVRAWFTNSKSFLLILSLQFGSAGMYVITMDALNKGMSHYVFVVYRNCIATVALAPFAFFLERKIRPKMTARIFTEIMALAFVEIILDQCFTFLGMKLTSASFASAVMNSVPSITFVLAIIFRMESMRIKQLGCQAKVIGTVVSLGGALLMAMYKGPLVNIMKSSTNHVGQPGNVNDPGADHWVMGACFLLIGCAGFSCFYILQTITLRKYPAEMSLATWVCFIGALQSTAVTLFMERHDTHVWSIGFDSSLFASAYSGIVTSAIQFYVQGKVIKTTGPVFVTAFNPLRMIIVTALACILLAEKLYLGSIIGGVVVVMGLYLVVWGKSKEQKKHLIPQSPEKEINLQLPVTVPINESNNDNKTQFVADKNNDIEA
ncbi:PREDICTED: WAT1-related protein At4g08290-like [Lupinus angustifolius]|uniref:WAT1-related protein At4g08290-like n=1 Tax=Lupinus angustifolius TaxID=3871 RepID=UPI00092E850C|nr:PREDICTED: WAT1-related protein At4g08290-like [Lupinus angustifolius]XP_019459542.1 PREDICTED: WAT1-related protein At4g08290-like [Lupinus angustifolius]XP_019459543.1 PREDICTED: WAT1-related protein At4g08290-like [Lupinus angustifolius]